MQSVEVNDIGSIGAVRDTPAYMLPPEAWTAALNMRVVDGGMTSMLGWEHVWGTALYAPEFLMPVSTQNVNYWLYAALGNIGVFDGVTHSDITGSVSFTATEGYQWNGTLLGGIAILNNGSDVPQWWSNPLPSVPFAALPNWTAGSKAKIVRAFGPHLVAFNVTDGVVNKPHLVRWSHPADPGTVPISWNVADPTHDAGEVVLPDIESGIIQDALPLGSTMFIYKENSIHRMRRVGGRFIMDFGEGAWISNIGLLAARCVANTGDGQRQVWATQDDILWHDGNRAVSLLNKKQKKRLSNDLDAVNFASSFMFANPYFNEMWFCYPSSGNRYPNRALVLNYGEGEDWKITEVERITFRHAAAGLIQVISEETWDGPPTTEPWDFESGPWATIERRRVICAGRVLDAGGTVTGFKFFKLDSTRQRDGVDFPTKLARDSLSLVGRKRSGEWIVDHQAVKLWDRLWPKVQGGPIFVRVGTQALVNGLVSWGDLFQFDPALLVSADMMPVSGRALSFEFSTPTALTQWRIDGYKVDIEVISEQ